MNAVKSTRWVKRKPSLQDRPVVMETVTENDALDDLTSAIDLSDGLARDCDTYLLRLMNNPQVRQEGLNDIRLWNDDPHLQDELRALFEAVRPDIVHTHQIGELMAVGPAVRRAGISNIVHTVCSTITNATESQIDEFAAIMEKLSPLLVATSEEAAERLPGWGNITVIPTGIDCERYNPGDQTRARRKIGLPGEPRIIGCASPLHGFEALLHALFRMDQDVHLALFSRARPSQTERGLIKQLGLDERVHLLGAWANPELVFQAIDLYFHGPTDDCMPRAVLAAQACGKPVIACPPTPNNLLCPQSGRLTPIQYMPTLLHNLQRALESNAQDATRQFIVENWNTGHSLKRYGALFRQLTDHDEPKRLPA